VKELVTPFRVGLVVIAAVVTLVYMIGQVREGIGDDPSGYRVFARFDDVAGLVEKSRVVIAGINVGQIDKIELDGARARVWVKVNTPLRDDATVARKQASLLGESFLQLTPGVLGRPLQDGDEIHRVLTDTNPADLVNELKRITENVTAITGTVRGVLSGKEGEERLVQILDNINASVAEVNRSVAANGPKVDTIVDNVVAVTGAAQGFASTFERDARTILEDVRAVTAEVRTIVGRNSGNVQEGFDGVRGAVSRLQNALDKLDGTLDRTRSIATKIDQGQGTIGRLVNDDKLVNSVSELVDESGRFVKSVTRLQTLVALRSEYYLGDGSVKNYFSLKFQPRADKYYMLQLVDDPRGRTSFKETVTSTTEAGRDPIIREQETVTDDRFRLSLQFAKRFAFVTGRVGIIESSGGVGADFHLLNGDLVLSTDLFGFDDTINPRMKLWGLYTFFTHLYVAAGVDDVWNDRRTDFFVGGGIAFNDEDLKALLTTAPTPSL